MIKDKDYKKIKRPWLLALVITSFYLYALFFINPGFFFDTPDDVGIARRLAGFGDGNPNPMHVYVNIVFGWIQSSLYEILPSIPWYTLFSIGIVVLNFYLVFLFAVKNSDKNMTLLMRVVVTALVLYLLLARSYSLLQFTQSATLCVSAGLMLFLLAVSSEKQNLLCALSGGVIFLGYIWRDNCVQAALPIIGLVFFYVFCKSDKKINVIIYIITLIVITTSADRIDINVKTDKELASYNEYNHYRALYMDSWNEQYSYDNNKEIYDAVDWDKPLYEMTKEWYTLDPRYNKDSLKTIIENLNEKYRNQNIKIVIDKMDVKTYLKLLLDVKNDYGLTFIFFNLLLLISLIRVIRSGKVELVLGWVALTSATYAEIIYLIFIRNRLLYRSFFSVIMVPAIILFVCAINSVNHSKKNLYYVFPVLVIGLFAGAIINEKVIKNKFEYYETTVQRDEALIKYAEEHKDNVYVYSNAVGSTCSYTNIITKNIEANIYCQGWPLRYSQWDSEWQTQRNYNEGFYTDNLFDDNVYYVTNEIIDEETTITKYLLSLNERVKIELCDDIHTENSETYIYSFRLNN